MIFWDDSGQLKYLDNIKYNDRTSRRHEVNDANPRQAKTQIGEVCGQRHKSLMEFPAGTS
jgi:hypothetical protein